MTTTLPVPLDFVLPYGWGAVPPIEMYEPGAVVAALHQAPVDGFIARITVSHRDDSAGLVAAADESVRALSETQTVLVTYRNESDAPGAPGLTQLLTIFTTMGGLRLNLLRREAYVVLSDVETGRRTAVEIAMTTTPGQFGGGLWDFQRFVRSVRLAPVRV